ncbi:TetR family transcriptional regulator [Actinorhabdospora filicis]|uniref:TetR family transcriptional regulator n=1 Tax=Actinorhabdospora filicis TaxID=1785913 RepID=A0A9W6ST14_9ACTN|nr:TetR/AcrR family transcriptional regulator [Actinorhabdospora filicis]GLZ80216.1 TetR family transcriptional regulator [Actinorhabdospora filicis]
MPVAAGESLDPARTRATILAAAEDLFYRGGLGLPVKELCAAVGASKETVYRHFGSKDGLIQAVVVSRSDRVIGKLTAAAEAGADPAARLAAIFADLVDWLAEPDYLGCAILNAATERSDIAGPLATTHLGRYHRLLTGIARDAGAADPTGLARQLLILIEGAIAVARHDPDPRATGLSAKDAALALLRASTESSGT